MTIYAFKRVIQNKQTSRKRIIYNPIGYNEKKKWKNGR